MNIDQNYYNNIMNNRPSKFIHVKKLEPIMSKQQLYKSTDQAIPKKETEDMSADRVLFETNPTNSSVDYSTDPYRIGRDNSQL